MEPNDLLKGFLLNSKEEPKKMESSSQDCRDLFTEMSMIKITTLQEINKDIEELLVARHSLQHELFADIDQAKIEINSVLSHFPMDPNSNPAVASEHLKLRQKIIELNEIKMKEKLDCWRDLATLKEEQRKNMQEMQEKRENLHTLQSLLA